MCGKKLKERERTKEKNTRTRGFFERFVSFILITILHATITITARNTPLLVKRCCFRHFRSIRAVPRWSVTTYRNKEATQGHQTIFIFNNNDNNNSNNENPPQVNSFKRRYTICTSVVTVAIIRLSHILPSRRSYFGQTRRLASASSLSSPIYLLDLRFIFTPLLFLVLVENIFTNYDQKLKIKYKKNI